MTDLLTFHHAGFRQDRLMLPFNIKGKATVFDGQESPVKNLLYHSLCF